MNMYSNLNDIKILNEKRNYWKWIIKETKRDMNQKFLGNINKKKIDGSDVRKPIICKIMRKTIDEKASIEDKVFAGQKLSHRKRRKMVNLEKKNNKYYSKILLDIFPVINVTHIKLQYTNKV